MPSSRSHLDVALASIPLFTNDGLLDHAELDKLLELAERDGTYDEDEKRVLQSIFKQAEQTQLDPTVAARITKIRQTHAIG
ncbi:hypothetical protein [Cognatilysobacter terrigena]|uniref:hypothetical protein n=1 Tax=Cognatilysobacter terrigena TaxID=2488749 RepID=UPI00105B861A|nr:hypothetical protein [Lysobacter terrigena]